MAPPSQIAIATSSLNRLVKEEKSYHKELEQQEAGIAKLEQGGGDDENENADFQLRQEVILLFYGFPLGEYSTLILCPNTTCIVQFQVQLSDSQPNSAKPAKRPKQCSRSCERRYRKRCRGWSNNLFVHSASQPCRLTRERLSCSL